MKYRDPVRVGGAGTRLAAGALAAMVLWLLPMAAWAESRRPNVVIFVADDLGWADTGYHGGPIKTPSIDRLAAEGVRMEHFYATPICSPTRAALMTARDPIRLGIAYDQIHPWYNAGLAPEEFTLAEAFKDAGYQTAMVGKWHIGHTQEHQLPNAQGFDEFYGHLHTNTDYYRHAREGGHDLQRNGKSVSEPGKYLTHLEAREAVRFVRERDHEKPFLLYVAFTAPHSPMEAPEETIAKYGSLPREHFRRIYAAMVDEMDQAMGRVLAAVDEAGLRDDTIVLFFSDNGGFTKLGGDNKPLRGEKLQTFEGGIRVPAVMRWPGHLRAGKVFDSPLSVLDMLPTLAAAAGLEIDPPKPLDGGNQWPALSGDAPTQNRPLYFVAEVIPGTLFTAVIDWPWKLVQIIREGQTETQTRTMLFRLDSDPNEQSDLARNEPKQVERLAKMMRERRAEHPLAGLRGTLVPHPGWVPAKDWADAVQPSSQLQLRWTNELPFSREVFEAIGDRGRLVDDATRERLIEQQKKRAEQWKEGHGQRSE